jgi:adenosine deaminase
VQTRAAPDFESHPLPFFYTYGLRITINTDNRLVTNTTVSKELLLIHQLYGLGLADLKELIISGFKSAFMPYREKADLLKKVTRELEGFSEPALPEVSGRPGGPAGIERPLSAVAAKPIS